MKLAWLCVALASFALNGCDKPCKQGFQRYGTKCVRSLVKYAGSDTNAIEGDDAAVDASPLCYLDRDGDGVGTGAPVPCPPSLAPGDPLVTVTGDCDDNDAARSPLLTDICDDDIDNDCDGKVDDESNNACGGSCNVQLGHQPGESCSNGLLGECERSGKYVCDGGGATRCDAATPSPSSEVCGDGKDNDCDGSKDENDASDATFWYQDCDGDGYAASTTGAKRSCSKPANLGTCGWTYVVPDPASKANWDCNDSSAAYRPGADYGFPPAGSTDYDLNCDGRSLPSSDYPAGTRRCGDTVVDSVNRGGLIACGYIRDCMVWKDASEKLLPLPAVTCPDTPFELTQDKWTGDGCWISAAKPPIWKCR